MFAVPEREPAASRWATRAAMFAFGLIATAAFLHRMFGMPTPVAFNLVAVALGIAVFSVLAAAVASFLIWQTGRPGTARVLFAVCLSLVLLAGPLVYLMWARDYPLIADITTDFRDPPEFSAVARLRGPGNNSIAYDQASFADEQARAYPDIKPLQIERSSEEAFALVTDALKRLKLHPAFEEAPDLDTGTPGVIELVDRSLIMGFYDDVSIRVAGDGQSARVDIRSAARFGNGDMGRNAERVRTLLKEIRARIDATTPAVGEAPARGSRQAASPSAKQEKGAGSKQDSRRRSRDRAP